MRYDHLVPRSETITRCPSNGHTHYFVPTEHIEATVGNNMCVRFRCKRCNRLVDTFLTMEEYRINENSIKNGVK